MISVVDQNNTVYVHFDQFKKIVAEKKQLQNMSYEYDTINAFTGTNLSNSNILSLLTINLNHKIHSLFIAMGGNSDKSGSVDWEKLKKTLVDEFELKVIFYTDFTIITKSNIIFI